MGPGRGMGQWWVGTTRMHLEGLGLRSEELTGQRPGGLSHRTEGMLNMREQVGCSGTLSRGEEALTLGSQGEGGWGPEVSGS